MQSVFLRNGAGATWRGDAVGLTGNSSVTDSMFDGNGAGCGTPLCGAIESSGGTVSENANLLFGNTVSLAGTIASGGVAVGRDPKFVLPQADNYHLYANSPARDAGVDASVNIDVDGDARPLGGGVDIGYDELNPSAPPLRSVHMPLVRR